jgi:integrase
MARIRAARSLQSRDARRELAARTEPYWHRIEKGLFLGYRKSAAGGAWLERRWDGERYREQGIATADDRLDSDGTTVMTFQQAQRRLMSEEHAQAVARSTTGKLVADAVRDYVSYQRLHRKHADESQRRLTVYLLESPIGDKRVSELTDADGEAWMHWALGRARKRRAKKNPEASSAPQLKTVTPAAPLTDDEKADRTRRRKSTLNRIINDAKACLRRAKAPAGFLEKLQKFHGVDGARTRWLNEQEAVRLVNGSAPDFRLLVRAGLQTGCRCGELLALRAGDLDTVGKTVHIAVSKSNKPRSVPLTEAGITLFTELTAGKTGDAKLFTRPDGSPWGKMALMRAMRRACRRAKIVPAASFHILRHSYASALIQANVAPLLVAHALGHGDDRMVLKHYGHLRPSAVADAVRAHLPSFGEEPANKKKVASIGAARSRRQHRN